MDISKLKKELIEQKILNLREMALDGDMVDYYYRFSNNDSFEEKIDSHLTNCEIKKLRKEPKIRI